MTKQNPNVTYEWCFPKKHLEDWICQRFKSSSPIYFHTIKHSFFVEVFIL